MNLSNFQVSITSAAIATLLLSIIFNWITLQRTKNFTPSKRKNEERLSSKYVPPFGGIACSIAFLISTRLLGQAESNFLYIGFFAVVISIIGLLDDLYNFKWYIKFIFQTIIVYIPLYNLNIFINFESLIGVEFDNSLNFIVSTIWIMLIMNAINLKPIPIYGNGLNIRDWLFVLDHCSAIDAVIQRADPGATYCIGGNNELKNIEVVEQICDLIDDYAPKLNIELHKTKSSDLISYVDDRLGHDKRYAIDSSKLANELNWKPEIKFTEGLKITVKWYLKNNFWWEPLIKD